MKVKQAAAQVGRRYRQIRDLTSRYGMHGLIEKLRTSAADRIRPREVEWPVEREDVVGSDLANPPRRADIALWPGEPVRLNWIMVPAGPRSGGHTTAFRVIDYLEKHGYENRVYFYNVYGGDHAYYESIVRSAYRFHGPVGCVRDGMVDAHGVVATGWATAYPAYRSTGAGRRFYFVQDYEPHFFPVGAFGLLAENTYRMGFHGITAGRWLATKLNKEFGMEAQAFEFGCDTRIYHIVPGIPRSGIVFYARPEAARRGYEIGLMTLEIFARRHPEIDIHLYGESLGRIPFPCIHHGRVAPEQLNEIYNRCRAALSISLTNVSLVPHEMLAAGCIPVVNDAAHNRMVLDNPFVRYARPDPHALAAELEQVVLRESSDALSAAAAASVRSRTWEDAGAAVDQILKKALHAEIKECVST